MHIGLQHHTRRHLNFCNTQSFVFKIKIMNQRNQPPSHERNNSFSLSLKKLPSLKNVHQLQQNSPEQRRPNVMISDQELQSFVDADNFQ